MISLGVSNGHRAAYERSVNDLGGDDRLGGGCRGGGGCGGPAEVGLGLVPQELE